MPFDYQPTLGGHLVNLRPLREDDFRDLYAVASDPLIWEQHPVKDRYREDVFRAFFGEALDCGGTLLAIDAASREVIGSSRFHGYDEQKSEVEIGWTFLARSHWGDAYNGEMKRLMLRHAFRFVEHVILLVAPDNLRSQLAVEKICGVRAGSRRDAGAGRATFTASPLPAMLSHCERRNSKNEHLGTARVFNRFCCQQSGRGNRRAAFS